MPRTDLARLRIESYRFVAGIPTRYADLDPQVHINNVAVASIYEEGRSQFLRWLEANAYQELEPSGRMIAEVKITYLEQLFHPSTLSVAAGIQRTGQRSYRIGQAIFQDTRCAGVCETVIVHSDGQRSIDITSAWRQALSRGAMII